MGIINSIVGGIRTILPGSPPVTPQNPIGVLSPGPSQPIGAMTPGEQPVPEVSIYGSRGLKRTSEVGRTRIIEEWRKRLQGKKKWAVFREMADVDLIVGGYLWNLQLFLGSAKWRVEPPKLPESEAVVPGSEKWAERMTRAMTDMDQTWEEFVDEVIYFAARDGAAPMERTLKRCDADNSKIADGFVGWKSWGIRPLETIWEYDWDLESDSPSVWRQQAPPVYKIVDIPAAKISNFRFRGAKNSPEGISLLSIAEQAYYYKSSAQQHELVGLERDLCGYPVMEVPLAVIKSQGRSAAENQTLEDMWDFVQKIRRDAFEGAVIPCEIDNNGPTGYKFRLMTSGGARAVSADIPIRRYEMRIAAGLGAGFMLAGMDGVGARSLDESKVSTFLLTGNTILAKMRETLNEALDKLYAVNGIPKMLRGTFEHEDLRAQDAEAFANYVKLGVESGALTIDKNIETRYRELGDIEPLGEDPELIPVPALAPPPPSPIVASVYPGGNGTSIGPGSAIIQPPSPIVG